ncbi:MAG: dTDP-4-dehydrorhamnose 3,5-epimerase [Solirubrobacteraceae bacterium]|jgi:dTDP-4-dehydrorhamnose 3,5-epimerase|nr:dTDP-4-dehydrorhamnose 3,5-epimerase [Solirubrobacteraceae bacterium]
MGPVRDVQTVDHAGRRIERLPAGMLVRDLITHADERGTVCELYDPRWGVDPSDLVFAYQFTIRPGMAKGWGVHREHEDRYAFLDGELELAFYDGREDSATAGEGSRLFLSQLHRKLLVIPRGVWHAERNVGGVDVRVVNFPTIQYDHVSPDKYRLPLHTDELPVRLGPEWRGG